MDKFEVGDVVVVKYDHAGMRKGEVGIVSHQFHEANLYEVYFKNEYTRGFYNIFAEALEIFED